MPTFDQMKAGYGNLWRSAKVRPERVAAVMPAVQRIIRDRQRYVLVEAASGVPWFWIACVHDRESSGDFNGILHNGEAIIGTGRKTTLVPKGRGPFRSWEEAAVDALILKGLPDIDDWSIERMLYEFERYNGFGYVSRDINSPYVWADTTLEQLGKFVADGKFSATTDDQQRGCAAVLKLLCEQDAGVAARVGGAQVAAAPRADAPSPPSSPPQKNWVLSLIEALMSLFSRSSKPTSPPVPPPPAPPAPPAGADRWMSIALKEDGVKETPGSVSTPRIMQIREEAGCTLQGDDGAVAWCKIFANWALVKAGLSVQKNWMARSIEMDPNFIELDAPCYGCLVSYWRNTKASGQGHINFYGGETRAGKIRGFGANQNNAINWSWFGKDQVTGYWWPKSIPLPKLGAVYVADDGRPLASAA